MRQLAWARSKLAAQNWLIWWVTSLSHDMLCARSLRKSRTCVIRCMRRGSGLFPKCEKILEYDYTGSDVYHGPNQDLSGGDDIGDTPYSINGGSTVDRYPLVNSVEYIPLDYYSLIFKVFKLFLISPRTKWMEHWNKGD